MNLDFSGKLQKISLLLHIAVRHLLGGRFNLFFKNRFKRWLSSMLFFIISAALGIVIAMKGSPVWGAVAFLSLSVILSIVRRLIHGSIPDEARGAYATAVTSVAILGITIAVMTLIVIVSVMDGFSENIQIALLKTTAEVMVSDFDEKLDPRIAKLCLQIDGVKRADPYVESDLLMKIDGLERPIPVKLRGETSSSHKNAGGPDLISGSWNALDSESLVIVGSEMARLYLLRPGDKLWFITSNAALTPLGVMPGMRELEVAGVFKSGFYEIDQSMVITGLQSAQELCGLNGDVTGIDVRGEDPYKAPELAEKIKASLSIPAIVMSWAETRKNLYEAMRTEKTAMFIIESLLILIASFNITSTLFMAIGRKTREIGLLRSLNLSKNEIMFLFAFEGFSIGAIGTLFGLLMGVGFSLYLEHFPVHMPGGGSVYYIDTIPIHLSWGLVAVTSIASILIAAAASVIPAYKASKISPAKALRYE